MAVDVRKYNIESSSLIAMLLPFFVRGKKVVRFLSAIAAPLDDDNKNFVDWVVQRIIDSVTTSQPIVLRWSLDNRFGRYFKSSSDHFDIIPYGYAHYLTIFENQDELHDTTDAEDIWLTEDKDEKVSSITDNQKIVILDKNEVKRESDSFTVISPPINNLIDKERYQLEVKQVIERYLVYKTIYKIVVREEI